MTIEGVRASASGTSDQIVGWDRVKKVSGDVATNFEPFSRMAETAWRARTRLERGDFSLAEPLFVELTTSLQGHAGPTAALASEGLLRCRLARGAQAAAIVPWLTWASIVSMPSSDKQLGKDQWVGGTFDAAAATAIDAEFLLPPSLPPVWVPGPALDSLVAAKEWETLTTQPGVPGQLAMLYRAAAAGSVNLRTASSELDELEAIDVKTPGARLVRDMLQSWAADPDEREHGRVALRSRLESADKKKQLSPKRWVEAWCRYAIGKSMIDETDEATRLLGIIELLHVPARFEEDQPYLAGMALAHAAISLASVGDAAGSQTLRSELATRYPRHPAIEWEPL